MIADKIVFPHKQMDMVQQKAYYKTGKSRGLLSTAELTLQCCFSVSAGGAVTELKDVRSIAEFSIQHPYHSVVLGFLIYQQLSQLITETVADRSQLASPPAFVSGDYSTVMNYSEKL